MTQSRHPRWQLVVYAAQTNHIRPLATSEAHRRDCLHVVTLEKLVPRQYINTQTLALHHFISRITAARAAMQVTTPRLRLKALSFYIHAGLLPLFHSEREMACSGRPAGTASSIHWGPVLTVLPCTRQAFWKKRSQDSRKEVESFKHLDASALQTLSETQCMQKPHIFTSLTEPNN